MENLKPFKTLNQQLKILRNKGLHTDSNSKRELEKIGYYSLINGYKTFFLEKDINGKIKDPERYREGSTFEEICNLYYFDKELRALLYEGILMYESMLSSKIAYYFSKEFQAPNAYLDITNFNNNSKKDIKDITYLISYLSNCIKDNGDKDTAIRHYLCEYGYIPLWVLVNFLTFGKLNHFYKVCKPSVQRDIAKAFTDERNNSYKREEMYIRVEDIISINKLLNHFRNAVAHNEITYSKRLYKSPSKISAFEYERVFPQAGVFEVFLSLKLMLRKDDYKCVYNKMIKLFSEFEEKFNTISFEEILYIMSFPENYNELLKYGD